METRRAPAAGTPGAVTEFGYRDGEILIRFAPDAEETAGALANRPPARLVFGDPALDALHTKYRASALTALDDGSGGYRLALSPDANVLRAADEYGQHPLVLWARPSYKFRIPRPEEEPGAVRTRVTPRGGK